MTQDKTAQEQERIGREEIERYKAWVNALSEPPAAPVLRTLKIVWTDNTEYVPGFVELRCTPDGLWFHIVTEGPILETFIRAENVLRMEVIEAESEGKDA